MNLKQLINEVTASEEKLTHLEHNEDHIIHGGQQGIEHAFSNLAALHDKIHGVDSDIDVQVKHDGSPSIVFGRHPETGKFFVASKSAFNKTPKINYTPEDVEKNHGHAPGLVSKLKSALQHLPKVTPKEGVYQGDIMYTKGDVKEHEGRLHFKPNTITYSTDKQSEEGSKIQKAKIGVLVHTGYTGKNFADLKAHYTPDKSAFKSHDDVHMFDNSHNFEDTAPFTMEQKTAYDAHIKAAKKLATTMGSNVDHLSSHNEHLKTFINKNIKDGTIPTIHKYKKHIQERFQKDIDKLKTETSRSKKQGQLDATIGSIANNQSHFKNGLQLHHHLQEAKNILVDVLNNGKHKYTHEFDNGERTNPEGYVLVRNNRPTKLVDRREFSRKNFEMSQNRK